MTLITFLIFNVVGGDPAFQLAGKNATIEQIESIRNQLGLDKPLHIQYLNFVGQIIAFDWGQSWHTQENINTMLSSGVGPSLSLTLPAFFISVFLSLLISLFSAYSKRRELIWDRIITTFCLGMMSISFLVYIICLQFFLAYYFGLFEINGWDVDWLERWRYLVLPWIISVAVSLGPNILIFRTALLDQVNQDYVRTGKAKGLDNFSLYFIHILKNALIPISTVVIMQIPFLMTGSLLLEAFFGIPGLGGLLIQAIQNSDFPVVKAFTVIGSILFLFFNLFSDLLYLIIDPRVSLE